MLRYLLITAVPAYFLLRYTSLGLLLARLGGSRIARHIRDAQGYHNGETLHYLVIAVFAVLWYIIIARPAWLRGLFKHLAPHCVRRLLLYTLFIGAMLVTGILHCCQAVNDEERDLVSIHVLEQYGLGAYLNGVPADSPALDKDTAWYLNWARLAHPPLHYMAGSSLSLLFGKNHGFTYYRLLFDAILLAWMTGIILCARRARIPALLLHAFIITPFAFSYLRTYTFIMSGNELIPFIAMSTWGLLAYLLYLRKLRFGIAAASMLLCCVIVTFLAKISTIIPLAALCVSLGILALSQGAYRRFFIQLCAVTAGGFVLAIGMYVALYWDTQMLQWHISMYAYELHRLFPSIVIPEGYTWTWDRESSVGLFVLNALPSYGPIVLGGFFYGCAQLLRLWRRDRKIDLFDAGMILWLLISMVGIVIVEPKTRYLLPATFVIIYIIARGLQQADNPLRTQQFFAAAALFTAADILLRACF
jgi:hypothetical protein